jgi:hypothetical protein
MAMTLSTCGALVGDPSTRLGTDGDSYSAGAKSDRLRAPSPETIFGCISGSMTAPRGQRTRKLSECGAPRASAWSPSTGNCGRFVRFIAPRGEPITPVVVDYSSGARVGPWVSRASSGCEAFTRIH